MKVKIKTWKQMEKEFGCDNMGNINCRYTFGEPIENQLPKNRIINIKIDKHDMIWNGWFISNDMVLKYY